MNREMRRAKKKKPVRGAGHIQLPINIRFSAQQETYMMLAPMLSADRIRSGDSDEGDWHNLAHRLNWGLLTNVENFNEGREPLDAALDVLIEIKTRPPTEDEFGKIMTALYLCDEMQKMCTRRELRDSLQLVHAKNEYLNKVEAIRARLDEKHS